MLKILVLSALITLCSCTKQLPQTLQQYKDYPGIQYVIDPAPDKEQLSGLQKTILSGSQWIYFILYLFLSCACVWYAQKTGETNETLWSIRQTIQKRLGVKTKIAYKLLKLLKRKRK